MVPGYVQGMSRAGPVKCRGQRGADGCFCYCEYLYCASDLASAQWPWLAPVGQVRPNWSRSTQPRVRPVRIRT
jgi:hypothetical protein